MLYPRHRLTRKYLKVDMPSKLPEKHFVQPWLELWHVKKFRRTILSLISLLVLVKGSNMGNVEG